MSGGVVQKLKDLITGEIYDDEYEDYEDYEEEYEEPVVEAPKAKKVGSNVVSLHTNASMKIVVHEPLNYEEAPKIVDDLRANKTAVVNLEGLDLELKKKIFNFLNGSIYAIDGNVQKVTKDIFVMSPSNVEIDGLKDELKSKGIFSW